jgi:hypothetical protein
LGAYILGFYGIHEWFADIDEKRSYWKEGEGIIHSILDYLSGGGFGMFMKENGAKWFDAQEYRNRHLIRAIESKSIF